jgi:hypothetical protein
MQDELLQAGQQAHAPHLLKAFYLVVTGGEVLKRVQAGEGLECSYPGLECSYPLELINTAAIIKDAKITLGKYIRFFASLRSEYMEVWRGGGRVDI